MNPLRFRLMSLGNSFKTKRDYDKSDATEVSDDSAR
jgi:hypothetical protein